MAGLNYHLRAKNSAQDLRVFIDKQRDGEISICIVGQHEGKEIQIDIEELSPREAEELGRFLIVRANGDPTV